MESEFVSGLGAILVIVFSSLSWVALKRLYGDRGVWAVLTVIAGGIAMLALGCWWVGKIGDRDHLSLLARILATAVLGSFGMVVTAIGVSIMYMFRYQNKRASTNELERKNDH